MKKTGPLGITVVVVAGISITMALTIFSGVRIASVFSVLTLIARWITITGEPARLVVAVIVSMLACPGATVDDEDEVGMGALPSLSV
jgi:hypothetical protein